MGDIFEAMERDERWGGFGYLGGRRNALAEGHADLVADVDARILAATLGEGWTAEELFAWANSKRGRWLADVALEDASGWAQAVKWELLTRVEVDA
jgi:hypothetical protein